MDRAALGKQAMRIMESGEYVAPSGATVSIRAALDAAIAGTIDFPPDRQTPARGGTHTTVFEARNETTLAAAFRLLDEGLEPAALNFASAKNPGGGFLGGARAQEESLARASGLWASIERSPMYAHHRARHHDAFYTDWVIYSPRAVFRDDRGDLLEEPRPVSLLTCPAVNAGVVLSRDRAQRSAIRAAMTARATRVLGVALEQGHDTLVLGAWGCGVFKNDPEEVAEIFAAALSGPFHGAFRRVAFAVLDSTEDETQLGPFARRFRAAP
jgi:uncharacterized protein (TIGR02452 family)